jgi:hypothetical protein
VLLVVALCAVAGTVYSQDYNKVIEDHFKGKKLFTSYRPGLYGIWADARYEHTYEVTSAGEIIFHKVSGYTPQVSV